MTTIAYRDGIMAADSRAYSGDKNPIGQKVKIRRLSDMSLFAASSSKVGQTDKLFRLTHEHGLFKTFPTEVLAQGIVVRPNGDIFYFNDQDCFTGPIKADYLAIGSGEHYATAALFMGATAERAIEVACALDPWTGGEIHTAKLIP